jgi:hypothetical protein
VWRQSFVKVAQNNVRATLRQPTFGCDSHFKYAALDMIARSTNIFYPSSIVHPLSPGRPTRKIIIRQHPGAIGGIPAFGESGLQFLEVGSSRCDDRAAFTGAARGQ